MTGWNVLNIVLNNVSAIATGIIANLLFGSPVMLTRNMKKYRNFKKLIAELNQYFDASYNGGSFAVSNPIS